MSRKAKVDKEETKPEIQLTAEQHAQAVDLGLRWGDYRFIHAHDWPSFPLRDAKTAIVDKPYSEDVLDTMAKLICSSAAERLRLRNNAVPTWANTSAQTFAQVEADPVLPPLVPDRLK